MKNERKKIEEALIHWRENQTHEWRQAHYFDCGPLGIVKLYVLFSNFKSYWNCAWLDIKPCPVLVEELVERETEDV